MMKSDMVLYEKVYQILKNKIECGLLPGGTKLPSRANLCREFNTSEKTVRRALRLLEEEGLVESEQRKRPTVAPGYSAGHEITRQTLQQADDIAANDILKTGVLLCYPLAGQGMTLCSGKDWDTPEAILAQMDPAQAPAFWRLSNRLWRFFVARNGNEFILRAVDSLGFGDADPLPGTYAERERYLMGLRDLLHTVRYHGRPPSVSFDKVFDLYSFFPEQGKGMDYRVQSDSPFLVGAQGLERRLFLTQERYSCVYMDLLGLIAVGRYRLGDRLPSHDELRGMYGVSIDTTIKAVQTLEEWGVVTAKRGSGIFVAMDLEELKKIQIDPTLIACHVRRYLDNMELLSLTVEGVAYHAAEHAAPEEAELLRGELDRLWEKDYLYQQSPFVLLDFLVEHIQYEALRSIYGAVRKNYHLGRGIPDLVDTAKIPVSTEIYQRCAAAADLLIAGDRWGFAGQTASMFQYTHRLVVSTCRRLGYWESAMGVYDGTALWK